jgi:isoleucyl-tRNA synthetase
MLLPWGIYRPVGCVIYSFQHCSQEDPVYNEVDPRQSFPKLEEEILDFWEKNRIFAKSIEQREDAPEFVFYDGPPFATGLPHFGHFVPSTIKDIIPRYKTMRGYRVDRRFGWDCHGLPVENLIEGELGLDSKTDIEGYGVEKFNEACRASVLRYTAEWRRAITRLGRWVDFDRDYKTMSPDYMESIWSVLKTLWDKGLLYEGHYILPYCPRCATVLSNHELNLGGYREVRDPAITIRFKVEEGNGEQGAGSRGERKGPGTGGPGNREFDATVSQTPESFPGSQKDSLTKNPFPVPRSPFPTPQNTYILAWTTTPWTLPSNLALVVGPDIDYVCVEDVEKDRESGIANRESKKILTSPLPTPPTRYILAEARLSAYYKSPDDYRIVWRGKGADLVGLRYEPLFPYFAWAAEKNAFRVYPGDFVSTEDGTGVVHTAPGFGEDDARVLKDTGIPVICPIDEECRFTADVPDYQGLFVKDADKAIMERLKAEGRLVRREQIQHQYPHCWRCEHPLIYRAVGSWFVDVQKIKQDMLDANNEIYWKPEHIKAGRFGKWLEGARDWAISRSRYWGNPLPVWRCDTCGRLVCVGSRSELQELSGVYPEDLHKHFVDKISFPCKHTDKGAPCSGTMYRVPEVLDCWFESGAMPYGQNHYPFEHKEFFESHFPADFISEAIDQTRGWFYSLSVLAAALFKKPAFKNCIVSGMVLASDGKKMSKHLKNYTDPMDAINMFGADAIRLFLIHSAVVKAEEIRYSDDGVREVLKSIILPLWNAYSFFVTYANIDGASPQAAPENPSNPLDRWILSVAESLIEKVTSALDAYDLSRAVDPILEFIDLLNNWYIRRSRRRFWRAENDADKAEAYATLYSALKTLITVAAPFMPFTTEAIWQNIVAHASPSVHLSPWPAPDPARRDEGLEFRMAAVMRAVSMGRALRSQYGLKVRQPLRMVELVTRNPDEKRVLLEMEDIIREELNVKQAIFRDNEEDLVEYEARANFRVLGKELGRDMNAAVEKIAALSRAEIEAILDGATLELEIPGAGGPRPLELTAAKLDVRRIEKSGLRVLSEGGLTVALDTGITEELSREGDVRDLVRGIQNLRKESGLDVTDRIRLSLYGSPRLKAAWEAFDAYIASETLATAAVWEKVPGMTAIEAGEEEWQVKIARE